MEHDQRHLKSHEKWVYSGMGMICVLQTSVPLSSQQAFVLCYRISGRCVLLVGTVWSATSFRTL